MNGSEEKNSEVAKRYSKNEFYSYAIMRNEKVCDHFDIILPNAKVPAAVQDKCLKRETG